MDDLKKRQIIKDVDNTAIAAIMFNPVKSIALRPQARPGAEPLLLDDLIRIIQDALLR